MNKFEGNSSNLQFCRYANGERKSKYQSAFLIYRFILKGLLPDHMMYLGHYMQVQIKILRSLILSASVGRISNS